MNDSIDDLLSGASDFDLCDGVFMILAEDIGGAIGERADVARTVSLVWHSYGIIGNGGFHYLFEDSFAGDPGYVKTAAAFGRIGAVMAHEVFVSALALFPNSELPADVEHRLEIYESHGQAETDRMDSAFWQAGDEIKSCLARFIRQHAVELRALLHA